MGPNWLPGAEGAESTRYFLGRPKKFVRLSAILAFYPVRENCLRDAFHHPHRHASSDQFIYSHTMGLVKKSREGCVLRKASRSPFSQTGNKDKMGESRAAILGRPKIDRVFSKNHPGSDFFTSPTI
ncbi:MAG: hypothetical protein A2W61_01085 [Deltaproteobacteria bacterium RIFCSPLOWO2_01_44_7]|nr:MAG: hypothetical protein A2712_00495 [Deltaproteobacteria bacterium RIFCSPHIGHO2_01_FULL_43_49]OGQ14246.1 MAG: hypothetical protein A3D22_10120 [Deltaproteobacteria bacterium RIFCSPHIGHO2_02_FULL_44_53]OGQ27462.1 MAG: hypothetical protein A3D98_03720 [Deltaproteobacteria bacterium RIFCSPHIGHO2_12_FULL_44_21]OGQ30710.1 MAG: hypothetical protein A2979_06145 [Deltaproteobacteria bacterium RIFCSPLOWO2_01_FULL_45_74]OGQ41212.1 MAG: hypothetical protein A2W61_01085 [Deltaproteobacteria bacterium 